MPFNATSLRAVRACARGAKKAPATCLQDRGPIGAFASVEPDGADCGAVCSLLMQVRPVKPMQADLIEPHLMCKQGRLGVTPVTPRN